MTKLRTKRGVTAWGSPSYEGGIDFHPETTPDTIVFHFYLPTADFNVLFEAIRSHEISALMLRLSNVSGFFSGWSPDIITDQIKVLSNPKDQGLDMPEEFASLKLSYGSIEKASLHAISAIKAGYVRESLERLRVRQNAWLNDEPDVEDSARNVAIRESNPSAIDLMSIHAMLSSMRIALWVAIAVLIVMLF